MQRHRKKLSRAMMFILLLGVVSMLSDMTHEGATSIRGAYLALLGASGATIGFISGFGELIGYSLRIFFGRLVDRTGRYWQMTILGYAVDVLAVPALALVSENGWIAACALLIVERAGKAIKKPAKNTILSFAASGEGAGRAFAIQEALDQLGAVLGPVLLYLVLLLKPQDTTFASYRICFSVLLVPALLTLAALLFARARFPHPERFEPDKEEEPAKTEVEHKKPRRAFFFYLAAISLFAFGFLDFSLITLHVSRSALVPADMLPLLYAGAMLADAVSALLFGFWYDKRGSLVLAVSTAISAAFSLFVFGFSSLPMMVFGVLLWGIGMGAQESILKAAVSRLIPKSKRATGYGIFECVFGVFWFFGSWLLGALYDTSVFALIAVSVGTQLFAIPLYLLSARAARREAQ